MKKIYFLSSLFLFFNHSVNSTPEVITEYDEKYSEVIELIMEKNKVDINEIKWGPGVPPLGFLPGRVEPRPLSLENGPPHSPVRGPMGSGMGPIGRPLGPIRYVDRRRWPARSGGAAGRAGFCWKVRTSAVCFWGVQINSGPNFN